MAICDNDDERFEILSTGLQVLSDQGVEFGDLRAVDRAQDWTSVRNDEVDSMWHKNDCGFGVRALVGDAWGYSAGPTLSVDEVARCAREAAAIARSSAPSARRPINLGAANPQRGEWRTPYQTDPIDDVSPREKVALLQDLSSQLRRDARIKAAIAATHSLRIRSWQVSTEGNRIAQETVHVGGNIGATAEVNGEVQQRTYPKHYDGNVVSGGWEAFMDMDLAAHSERVSSEAIALCTAPPCPEIKDATVILEGGILSLQVHESCGHPTELDRAFGEEVSLAGASFLTPDRLGKDFQYGSNIVTLYADSLSAGGCGTFGWDDEGTPARRTDLVKNGVFVGYLSGREAAQRINRLPAGSLRAEGWYNIPIVRMVNINLEPGDWEFDELIADTDDGMLLSNSKSWSIDDRRLNFQFGCELAREIKGGKLGQIYRNPVYTGITPNFWNSCDAICNQNHWQMWGYLHCGKGDPCQTMHVGHGVAPARFRGGVHLGST